MIQRLGESIFRPPPRVRAGCSQEACDYEFVRDWLADPGLTAAEPLSAAPEGRAHPDSRSVRRNVTTWRAERRTAPGRRGDASCVAPADHRATGPALTGTDLRQEDL